MPQTIADFIRKKERKFYMIQNREMDERRQFMKELTKYRGETARNYLKEMKSNVGPTWYQVLSIRHRMAINNLANAIYRDKIEREPVNTMRIIRILGILPRPNRLTVQHCMYYGSNDPKEFLAQIFHIMYNHPISGKRYSYDLTMRVILSSIYYLGLNDLISELKERFKAEEPDPPSPPKQKKKRKQVQLSPYLQKMTAAPQYEPAFPKRKSRPPPLPDLSFLDLPFEEEPTTPIRKPQPPPPPPPPPKKRISRTRCDQVAGIVPITQPPVRRKPSEPVIVLKKFHTHRRLRSSKLSLQESKKKIYGIGATTRPKKKRTKPKPPSTGLTNVPFMIVGVYTHKENTYYIIGNVCIIPPQGILINGGQALMPNGEYGIIYSGFCEFPQPIENETCECLEKWDSAVFDHIDDTKCYCDHRYDFDNEGTFPEEEPTYFVKPSRKAPMQFNYDIIYQLDPKLLELHMETKKIWDNESIFDDPNDSEAAERKNKKKKKKEILRRTSEMTKKCLGNKPSIEDYLHCAIRYMGRINAAARLPDIHLAPELQAWMRLRIYGQYSAEEKKEMFRRSVTYWSHFKFFMNRRLGKAPLPSDPSFSAHSTWKYKLQINKQFRKVMHNYRVKLYKAQAYANNLLWATTYHAKYPDKNFREIYFTYLAGRVGDVEMYRPYCRYETLNRASLLKRKRYICLPKVVQSFNQFSK